MRLTFLTASVSRNGAGVSEALRRLAITMAQLPGVSVSVLGLRDRAVSADLPLWNGIPVAVVDPLGPRSFGFAPRMLSTLDRTQPDILHTHGIWMYPSLAGRTWARAHRRPYLVSPHGMLDAWALGNSRWKKRLAAWLYENRHLRSAASLHALNEAEAQAIRAYGLSNPIAIIPNGVDAPGPLAASSPPWVGLVREGAKILLYLGRLHPKKALPDLLRAWRLARPCGNSGEWQLVIAGWDQGGHEQQLQKLAEDLGILETLSFLGPQFGEQKDAAFRCASAFVLPSLSEGLPMAPLEAWAYGLPVLMTPQCNLPEGFAAGAALRVEPNPDSIAAGLRELFAMSDRELHDMGERGRKLVAERFSWPRIAAQMKQVYEWVLGGGPAPDCVVPSGSPVSCSTFRPETLTPA